MRVTAGLLALASAAALAPGRAAEPTQRDLLEAVERQLKAVHEAAGPGVACVVVSRSDKYPKPAKPPDHAGQLGGFSPADFLKNQPDQADLARRLDLSDPQAVADHGSAGGVVIDAAGLVLTNYHTTDGAAKIYVHLPGGKGSYADIHAADARAELAVLRLLTPPADLKPVRLGTVRFPDGDPAKATAYPGKLVVVMTHPVVAGVAPDRAGGALGSITNVRRPDKILPGDGPRSVYHYAPLLEYDARTNPGCSGAAVLNLDGELVGLTTAAATPTGGDGTPGVAHPIDDPTRRVIDVLRRGEEVEYGFLGVTLDNLAPDRIVVDKVSPRGPAERAGVRAGDTIARINGHPSKTYADLLYHVGSTLAGGKVRMTLRGPAGDREVEATVAKFKAETPFIASARPAPVFGLRVDYGSVLAGGVVVGGVQAAVPPGVAVRDLTPDSPAAAKFKALGENARWVVTHADGTLTPTPPDFYAATKGRPSVRLTVLDAADPTARPREVTLP